MVAGLLVALNGTLIVYEHYVMAETLFTFLLAAAALALVLGARREPPGDCTRSAGCCWRWRA